MTDLPMLTRPMKLKCNFSTIEALGSIIIWVILSVVTLGLALLVFPYYFNRSVLNQTEIVDGAGRAIGRLNCTFNIGHSIGHMILWVILIIITLGFAAFLYVYRVLRVVLNETRIEMY